VKVSARFARCMSRVISEKTGRLAALRRPRKALMLEGSCMSVHIALLRGINVGGPNMVAMSDLRDLFGALGLAGATSLLQSGNLLFQSGQLTGAALEDLLEVETAKRLNVSADYFVRSAAEWDKIVARNPFPEEAKNDPGHLLVMFLKTAPPA